MAAEPIEPITCSIETGTQLSGLGRTQLFNLIGAGAIEARKSGTRTLIVVESLRRYVLSLLAYNRSVQARKVHRAVEGRQAERERKRRAVR